MLMQASESFFEINFDGHRLSLNILMQKPSKNSL